MFRFHAQHGVDDELKDQSEAVQANLQDECFCMVDRTVQTVFDFSCLQRLRGSKWNLAGGDVSLALHKGKNRTVTASQV